jgi:hypothetical protein
MVLSQLRSDLSRAMYDTWVEPLQPLGYHNHIFSIGAANPYNRDWVTARLQSRIARLLEGLYNEQVSVSVVVNNGFFIRQQEEQSAAAEIQPPAPPPAPAAPAAPAEPAEPGISVAGPVQGEAGRGAASSRKVLLQRAYGSQRARVIQPERGMFITLYFFNSWLPLLGHSAATVILAARSLCYWNPMTGELRNMVETEMADLAARAAVSVRTVKDVLANELVQRYFLRYRVRRTMTPNGIRTAGILLQVRMDDPLTPEDQAANNLPEEERWYANEFDPEDD